MMRKDQLEQAEKELASAQEEDTSLGEIVLHPDGYHWVASDGRQEFGPFETREQAMADRDASEEEGPSPGETLQEAEDEIGIAAWIDPETGEPAEGLSHPRLEE
jgi:hypothetical protein